MVKVMVKVMVKLRLELKMMMNQGFQMMNTMKKMRMNIMHKWLKTVMLIKKKEYLDHIQDAIPRILDVGNCNLRLSETCLLLLHHHDRDQQEMVVLVLMVVVILHHNPHID